MRNRPVNICFYISDYGYGHAARDIAIIRRILIDCNANIFVKSEGPYRFIEQSLPNATAVKTRNDIDLAYIKNSVVLDKAETEKRLNSWLLSWDEYISNEIAFCSKNNIDLILSDIVPQAFIVADELGLPGVGISNFTWHYIFFNIFGKTDAVTSLEKAYARGEMALVLPFNEKMSLFKRRIPIGLVSRYQTMDRSAMRKKYNIGEDELLVYIGVGRSMDTAFLKEMKDSIHPRVRFLLSSGLCSPLKNAIKIPAEETETQDYIAMCDLVVSKTGYSTVSEALKARVPMLLFRREGFKEDCLIADEIKRLGIGDEISEPTFLDGGWIDKLDQMEEYRGKFEDLDDRFKRDGASEAFGVMMDAML
jgi:uncharacterized protein (TIGR00661 family)